MYKLSRDFYERDTLIVAKELLGKYLVYNDNDEEVIVKITEVEAYKGIDDKACHTITKMSYNRYNKAYEELNNYQKNNFSNGPGKLCKALALNLTHNGMDFLSDNLYIYNNKDKTVDIKRSKRINIDYAEEAADYLWRFYI
ncbi:DNA-3-methyladenine glycosylase [Vallitalea sp.]|jgi:DNA-3-methyladenine glycosylase|uniref:DNA-3-methyladenine glycosylase n=1 Tax=Vallitalea sp. TaxID=1882829 RepID=UPI0025E2AB02|nr:DNA-3-methyladenine glycosylase [Vallitalea sp.]MCT4686558.1 DNA-3-methyladenine glycosylase [Vallitalea sp.]